MARAGQTLPQERQYLKGEEKVKQQREKAKRKKEKKRAKGKEERECKMKCKGGKKRKGKRNWSDSDFESTSLSNSLSDLSLLSNTSSLDGKSHKGHGKGKASEERKSQPGQLDFKWIIGNMHFCMRNGQWQDCWTLPSKRCMHGKQLHWAF